MNEPMTRTLRNIQALTPEQKLTNLANLVNQLTTPTRRNVRKADNFAASKEEIADASRQLAETVLAYLAGELATEEYDDEIPF